MKSHNSFKSIFIKGCCFLCTLFILFCSLSPAIAYAEGTLKSKDFYTSVTYLDNSGKVQTYTQDGFTTVQISNTQQQNTISIDAYFKIDSNISSGDILTIQYNLLGARYQRGFEVLLELTDLSDTSPNNLIVSKNYNITWGTDNSDYQYLGTTEDSTTNILVLKSLTISRNINAGDLFVHLRISNIKYVNNYPHIYYGFPNVVINSDSKSTGLLNSIIEWIKSIWSSIAELPNAIGNFIVSLGDSIKGFFTDLTANLKAWFASIGDWFSALGDRISGFFSNLIQSGQDNTDRVINGDEEYEDYEFSSGLTEVLTSLEDYCDSLDDTMLQIDNASTSVSEYIKQGTSIIDSIFDVFPAPVIVLVMFGIVFIFARKVVGR